MFIDASYFETTLPLVVVDNEAAINNAIEVYEPDYLRAVLGQSLYEAFMTGLATPSGVYFSNQFSDQFYKGAIADRWKWIRYGHVFTHCGRKLMWPGLENTAKRSPVANYVYWYYLKGRNPSASSTGTFTTPKMENANVVSPYRPMMQAWNAMVDWNKVLLAMITGLTDNNGAALYPEFVRSELNWHDESINVYNNQTLF